MNVLTEIIHNKRLFKKKINERRYLNNPLCAFLRNWPSMVAPFKKKNSIGILSKNIPKGVHTKIILHDRPYKNNPHDHSYKIIPPYAYF